MTRTALLMAMVVGMAAALTPTPAGAAIWRPAPGTSWQIQYTGTIDLQLDVAVFYLDLFDTSEATITGLAGHLLLQRGQLRGLAAGRGQFRRLVDRRTAR